MSIRKMVKDGESKDAILTLVRDASVIAGVELSGDDPLAYYTPGWSDWDVPSRLDEVDVGLNAALDEGVITVAEFMFLRKIAVDIGASRTGIDMAALLGLTVARMNAAPGRVHPALRASYRRLGVSLEDKITRLPYDFADRDLLRSTWRHLPMIAGLEVHEAIVEVCRLAAEREGIELGPVPTCADSQREVTR